MKNNYAAEVDPSIRSKTAATGSPPLPNDPRARGNTALFGFLPTKRFTRAFLFALVAGERVPAASTQGANMARALKKNRGVAQWPGHSFKCTCSVDRSDTETRME